MSSVMLGTKEMLRVFVPFSWGLPARAQQWLLQQLHG